MPSESEWKSTLQSDESNIEVSLWTSLESHLPLPSTMPPQQSPESGSLSGDADPRDGRSKTIVPLSVWVLKWSKSLTPQSFGVTSSCVRCSSIMNPMNPSVMPFSCLLIPCTVVFLNALTVFCIPFAPNGEVALAPPMAITPISFDANPPVCLGIPRGTTKSGGGSLLLDLGGSVDSPGRLKNQAIVASDRS